MAKAGIKMSFEEIRDHLTSEAYVHHEPMFPVDSDQDLLRRLAGRARWMEGFRDGAYCPFGPFSSVHAHKLNAETVVVFVARNGQHVTLDDSTALFPSDKLLTQLNLIIDGEPNKPDVANAPQSSR